MSPKNPDVSVVERLLVFACAAAAPLFSIRFFGVNLTLFDTLILLLFGIYLIRRPRLPRLPGFYGSAVTFVLAALGSAFFAVRPSLGLIHALEWAFAFFVVVPTAFVIGQRTGTSRSVVLGFVFAAAFLFLHSVWEVQTGRATYWGGRYDGFLGGANPMAYSITTILPFVLVTPVMMMRQSEAWIESLSRVLWMVLVAVLALGLIWVLLLAASVTGALALIVGCSTLLWLRPLSRKPRTLTPGLRRILTIVVIATIFAVGLAALFDYDQASAFALLKERILAKRLTERQIGRIALAKEVLAGIDARTLMHGVGFQNYIYQPGAEIGVRPHNIVLLLLVESGILGVVSFAGIVSILLIGSTRYLVAQPVGNADQRYLAVAAITSFLVFMTIAFFNTQSIHRIYWFIYGLALGLVRRGMSTVSPEAGINQLR